MKMRKNFGKIKTIHPINYETAINMECKVTLHELHFIQQAVFLPK